MQDAKVHFVCAHLLKIIFSRPQTQVQTTSTLIDVLKAPIMISVGLQEIDILDVLLLEKMLTQHLSAMHSWSQSVMSQSIEGSPALLVQVTGP